MRFFFRIRSLLANLLGKEKVERQLDNELQAYVEMATDEKIAAGVSAFEARRTTLADFGGMEQVKQAVRDRRAGTNFEVIIRQQRCAMSRAARQSIHSSAVHDSQPANC